MIVAAPAPDDGPNDVMRGIPFNRDIRAREEAEKYGIGPTDDVPFSETAYAMLEDLANASDPVLWAHAKVHWGHRLLPAVREATRVETAYDLRLETRQATVRAANRPLEERVAVLISEEAKIRDRLRRSLDPVIGRAPEMIWQLGSSLGEIGQELDADQPGLARPEPQDQHSAAAQAADLKLPHDLEEKVHFLKPFWYWAFGGVMGSVFGLSMAAIPGIVVLSNLSRSSPFVIAGALAVGVAATTTFGTAVRLLFRLAAEQYYAGRRWWLGSFSLATLLTLLLAVVYATVDGLGLMKANANMMAVASLGGHAGPDLSKAYFIASAALASAYFVATAVTGWMKERTTAANHITKAIEDERIAARKEQMASDDFIQAVSALNDYRSLDLEAAQLIRLHEQQLLDIGKEREALISQLQPLPEEFTDEERWILNRARSEAEGRQREFDEMIMLLRLEISGDVRSYEHHIHEHQKDRGEKRRIGFAEWIRSLIERLSNAGEKKR